MKRITLIRHAKASWDADIDKQRTLHEHGEKDAPEMGRRLHDAGLVPDYIRSSSAKRATQTASLLIGPLGVSRDRLVQDNILYNADVDTLFKLIQQQEDESQHLMIVGHNPGMTELCNRLDKDFRIDDLPTCAVSTFDFDVEHWSAIAPQSGKLVFFDYPANKQAIHTTEAK